MHVGKRLYWRIYFFVHACLVHINYSWHIYGFTKCWICVLVPQKGYMIFYNFIVKNMYNSGKYGEPCSVVFFSGRTDTMSETNDHLLAGSGGSASFFAICVKLMTTYKSVLVGQIVFLCNYNFTKKKHRYIVLNVCFFF